MESCSSTGHQDRQKLDELLKLPRPDVTLNFDYKLNISLGAGKVKETSVRELAEEYKDTEEGQLLLNGGSLIIPVVDHVKKKFGLKSVETRERMERDLVHIHDKGRGKKNRFFLGNSPKQRTPSTHPYGLGLT